MTILAIKPRRPAAGVTLTEVLIAMGILAIGLLGVASVFPVGGYYMQQGEIADRGSAIAQAALDDAIVRGHLNPENWGVHDVQTGRGRFMNLVSGRISASVNDNRVGMRQAITDPAARASTVVGGLASSDENFLNAAYGSAYVIDPVGLAGALAGGQPFSEVVDSGSLTLPVRHFPASAGVYQYALPQWAPWNINGIYWPVRRVTTVHAPSVLNSNAYAQQETIAREYFVADDDLALTLPSSGDNPSRQQWETWGASNAPSARESRGDYSWIISIAPASPQARDSLALQPDAYQVEVSVVVFYKRITARGSQNTADAEKLVDARVLSATPGGGELSLTKRSNDTGESPFEDLRPGHYVMVVGPHPLSSDERPILALRWCRVLNLEDRNDNVLVSLRGPDWPWGESDPISQDLRVGIVPGAVAVHTKTMRLEAGSEWSVD